MPMQIPAPTPNAVSWQALKEQTAPKPSQASDLPALAPGSPAWNAFTRDAEVRTPYISQLNQSVRGIHQYIEQHAAPGAAREVALSNLQHLLQAKINCRPGRLSALMVNENRRNLNLFVQQLNNPAIPTELKLGAALHLAKGLGVCDEGETLNILESTQQLCNQQTGLAGVLVNTKNTLIEQHLQQLVMHEDSIHLSANLAKLLEIHHVQALKNYVAQEWGLTVVDDRHATPAYMQQAGNMAVALLRQTITPAVLAHTVAEKLGQALASHTAESLYAGLPAEQLKTEPLRRAIQAEFGSSIELQDCLDFNDDYSEVRLKPQQELALLAMKTFQDMGLVNPHAEPKQLLQHTAPPIGQVIRSIGHLRGAVGRHTPNGQSNNLLPTFWFGHLGLSNDDRRQKEKIDALHQAHH